MGLQIDSFRLPFYLLCSGVSERILGMKSPWRAGRRTEKSESRQLWSSRAQSGPFDSQINC